MTAGVGPWLAGLALVLSVVVAGFRAPAARLRELRPGARSDPVRWSVGALATGALSGSLVAAARVPAGLVAVVLLGAAVAHVLRDRRSRHRAAEARRGAVIELTFAVAAELRAGRQPAEALAAGAFGTAGLGELCRRADADGHLRPGVLDEVVELPGAERLRYLAAALGTAELAGARVADLIDGLGAALATDEELRGELEAALSGPRASMLMLAVLPAFGVALGEAIGAHPLALLLHWPLGWGLTIAAIGLDLVGVAATRAITRSVM